MCIRDRDCAVRECREELGVEIQLQGLREETVYEYPDGLYGFAFYDGVIISGEPEKRVHLEIRWVSPEELTDFSFCPADRPMVCLLYTSAGSSWSPARRAQFPS